MDNITFKTYFNSPVGWLKITTSSDSVIAISFVKEYSKQTTDKPPILTQTVQQLTEYFEGKRKLFNLKLKPSGSDFQNFVWQEVIKIDFGNTASYLDIAIKTGSPKNTRAVGLANGKNPIPIIIPCHRIIGTNGKLTGYAGGIETKRWLLLHELKFSNKSNLLF